MIEYQDGSTSDVGSLDDVMEQFMGEVSDAGEGTPLEDTPAALHVGSEDELEKKQEKKDLQSRLDELEDEVEKMKAVAQSSASPRGSSPLPMPSPEEVVQFSDQSVISRVS